MQQSIVASSMRAIAAFLTIVVNLYEHNRVERGVEVCAFLCNQLPRVCVSDAMEVMLLKGCPRAT